MNNLVVAPSFNGRTADSGSAYRGSNPWGAANRFSHFPTAFFPRNSQLPHNFHINAGDSCTYTANVAKLLDLLVRPIRGARYTRMSHRRRPGRASGYLASSAAFRPAGGAACPGPAITRTRRNRVPQPLWKYHLQFLPRDQDYIHRTRGRPLHFGVS